MQRIELADFLLIAEAVLGVPAGALLWARGAASISLAESALAAPFAGFGEVEFYPDPLEKAAILCSRIVRNHPLYDGNKRVGYLCMREFMARNGIEWRRPGDDETAQTIEDLAAGTLSEDDWVGWVRRHVK